ncbi:MULTISPECIES: S49 family peptidase [unclassified Pseudonocardia]|uniref:S49 family peptidase n=1 Tax=unclassified Pseudonocardia TaxID=2619320 RepID=UPI00096982A8|nr:MULTISPECIES: S49 family peptidase [unclassified Pseudonocardia]MBN9096560.1 S49 family peptidase [Pseudonocardia sp.]OJY47433.1 MAG: S49 family peptidase [Pseudonocardia sp. 73-21]
MRIPDRLASHLPGRLGERGDRSVVSMVRLQGVIASSAGPVPRAVINATTMEKTLERAFAPDGLAAVALLVNSPGGSPTQSALVADRIRGLAAEHEVPVLAFCEDVAASGGYWLACAADEIYAHPTSLVGSIGVITQSFGLDGLIERFGIERRLYTAGESKSRLDPFLPEKSEDVEWLHGLQDQLHTMFKDWVVSRRGDRLRGAKLQGDLFTGEVWTGARALELGLIDGLGTARGVLTERFPDAELVPVEGRKPLLARLGLAGSPAAGADLLLGFAEAARVRAAWARYGL